MAVALASLPLPLPPPSSLKFSLSSRRSCRCTSTLSQGDLISSPPTTSTTYRPAVILPGLGNNTNDYQKLALVLKDYGVPTVIAKVSRIDWLRNAAGLLDSNYWRGTLRPRPVLDWYLKRVEEAVNDARNWLKASFPVGSTLSLIGHSAGGWLARVYLQEFGISDVSLLLTLGTPHLYIQGARLLGSSDGDSSAAIVEIDQPVGEMTAISTSEPASTTLQARFIGQGYKQVCGQADVWGDGVVPEMSAHLDGALNISLDGVYHSPVGSDDETRPWYGSPAIVEQWIHHLLN
ncbi:UNVERIFIED_CONTAM: hypothetical protein Sangu_0061200 [Sesamum angustifolium]|uniref:GPI inositol-deacylase n=1 Tax=Sesamum angustifolium TaxID=2727405 RepID=A0AAW2RIQ2_9LAMI